MIKICDDPQSRAKGLMGVKKMGENDGAYFIYSAPQVLSFWGHETYLPLDIAFIRADGTISSIETIDAFDESFVYSVEDCQYALEMNRGWFERHGYEAEMKLKIGKLGSVQSVLDRLPVDIYEVVKDIPVNTEIGTIRGWYNDGVITLWDDGSSQEILDWTLAHEYWHAFMDRANKYTVYRGLSHEVYTVIKERMENEYYDERKGAIADEFIERHLSESNILLDLDAILYSEMMADALADLVIGKDHSGAVKSYADAWISEYIYSKFGSEE